MRVLILAALALAAALLVIAAAGALFFRWYGQLVPREAEATFRQSGEQLLAGVHGPVAVFAAHPDDVEYWLGGTLARLAQAGVAVDVILASRGEKGGSLPNLAAIRTQEQLRAAARLGYRKVIWLDLPDRGVKATPALVERLVGLLEQIRPQLVFGFDAEKPLPPYLHPDHQAMGRATAAAFAAWTARPPGVQLCLFHTRRPNVLVDVRSTLKLKLEAFAEHESQHGPPRPALRVVFALLRILFPRQSERRQPDALEALYCPNAPGAHPE